MSYRGRGLPPSRQIEDARTILSGLPIFVTIGRADYRSQDRSRLTEILDGYELLCRHGWAMHEIKRFHGWARRCHADTKIVVAPSFFPGHLRAIAVMQDALLKANPGLDPKAAPGAVQAAAIGAKTVAIDARTRPMAFIAHAVAWHFKVPVDALYIPSKTKGAREKPAATIRQGCYALIHDLVPSKSTVEIGRHFGRDHTSVLHGIYAIKMKKHQQTWEQLLQVRKHLSPWFPEAE